MRQICRLTRTREIIGKKKTKEISYFITTLSEQKSDPQYLLNAIRQHWFIENNLHRTRDVVLGEDRRTTRKGHGPQNIATLNNLALFLGKRMHSSLTIAIEMAQMDILKAFQAMVAAH